MRLERRRAPVGHEELAAPAASDRDAVREGRGEQRARPDSAPSSGDPWSVRQADIVPDTLRLAASPRGRRASRPSGDALAVRALRSRRQSARQASCVFGALRAIAAEGLDPGRKIDGVSTKSAFGQHDRYFARDSAFARSRGVDDHPRETRRQREADDRAPLLGDAAVAVDGADRGQKRLRLPQRRARRGIEESEFARIGDAPQSAVERETGEIGGENFRRGVRLKAAVRGLLPQR